MSRSAIQTSPTASAVLALLASLFLGLFFALDASANIDNPADAHTTFQNFDTFITRVNEILANIMVPAGSELRRFWEILYLFFTGCLIIGALSRYVTNGITFPEVFEVIVLIVSVRVLMIFYHQITTGLWGWSEAFGRGIQTAAFGNPDDYFIPAYIKNAVSNVSFGEGADIWDGVTAYITIAAVSVILFIISAFSFIASAWPVWGFAAAKLVGWMFIPTLLIKRTSFLFDGWVRFFFGFLLYNIFIRVNLVLTGLVFSVYFDRPVGATATAHDFPSVDDLMDVFGLMSMCLISLAGMWSTGKFAAAIAGGAGGAGDALRSVARVATLGKVKI